MHVKAAVEQPIFVTPLAAIAKRTVTTMTALPIDKVAMNKLATALREQPADQQAVGSLGEKLTIPIDEGRKLFAEGLVAFAKGDIATARAFFVSAASAGDARALVGLGDTFDPRDSEPSRRRRAQGRRGQGARLLFARGHRRGARGSRASGFSSVVEIAQPSVRGAAGRERAAFCASRTSLRGRMISEA